MSASYVNHVSVIRGLLTSSRELRFRAWTWNSKVALMILMHRVSSTVAFMVCRMRLFTSVWLLAEEVRRFMSVPSMRARFLVLVMLMSGVAVQIRSGDRYAARQISFSTNWMRMTHELGIAYRGR